MSIKLIKCVTLHFVVLFIMEFRRLLISLAFGCGPLLLVSCDKEKSSLDPVPAPIPSDVSWTQEQWETVQSLRQIDEEGYLYEINYTADYKMDDVLALNASTLTKSLDDIRKTILPQTMWNLETQAVGSLAERLLNWLKKGLGCTCFTAPNGEGFILGRNYDYPPINDHQIIVHTPQVKNEDGTIIRHATVGCADISSVAILLGLGLGYKSNRDKEIALYSPYFILDGINDAGLMCGLMIVEYDGSSQKSGDGKLNLLNAMITRLILDNCTTVSEAIRKIGEYAVQTIFQFPGMYGFWTDLHFLIADKYNDKAVVEWINGEMRVLRPSVGDLQDQEPYYALSTNFYLSKSNLPIKFLLEKKYVETVGSEFGYWRYDQLTALLKEKQSFSIQDGMNMLQSVKVYQNDPEVFKFFDLMYPSCKDRTQLPEWNDMYKWPWITLYSEVFDTNTLTMTYCLHEDFSHQYIFGIDYKK